MPATRPARPIPSFMMGFPALVMVLALGFGLPLAWQARDFVRASEVVPAEVTAVRSTFDCSSNSTVPSGSGTRWRERNTCSEVFYPTVRYRTITGVAYENEVMGFLNGFDAAVGDRIDVRYRRDDPELVQVDRWATIWGIPLGLLAVGTAFGAFFFWLRSVNARAARSGAVETVMQAEPLPLWVVATTLIAPFGLTYMTGVLASGTFEFWRNSEPAEAVIVAPMQSSTDPPVLRFADRRGNEIEGEPETVPFEMLNVPGRAVPVLYRTDDPHVFRAAPGAMSIWWPTITVGIFAGVFGVALVGALVFMSRG